MVMFTVNFTNAANLLSYLLQFSMNQIYIDDVHGTNIDPSLQETIIDLPAILE